MSIQDEFREAGREYARRIDERREAERLAALTLEARKEGNADAFADAIGPLFTTGEPSPARDDTDTKESD